MAHKNDFCQIKFYKSYFRRFRLLFHAVTDTEELDACVLLLSVEMDGKFYLTLKIRIVYSLFCR